MMKVTTTIASLGLLMLVSCGRDESISSTQSLAARAPTATSALVGQYTGQVPTGQLDVNVACTVTVSAAASGFFGLEHVTFTVNEAYDPAIILSVIVTPREIDQAITAAGENLPSITHNTGNFFTGYRDEKVRFERDAAGNLITAMIQISTARTGIFDVHTESAMCTGLKRL